MEGTGRKVTRERERASTARMRKRILIFKQLRSVNQNLFVMTSDLERTSRRGISQTILLISLLRSSSSIDSSSSPPPRP